MTNADRFILSAIVVGLAVNLASSFLGTSFPILNIIATIVIASVLTFWIVYKITVSILQYIRYGRYAILVFFMSRENKLLLIKHPYHGCFLPPGGRLEQLEVPHLAVKNKLKEEAGITDYEFHPRFHNPNLMISEVVEDVPCPYSVHMEYRRQRGFVKSHYAFVYVCRSIGEEMPLSAVPEYQPRWMSLEEIYKLPKELRPFDDIIRRYEDILVKLGVTIPNQIPGPARRA